MSALAEEVRSRRDAAEQAAAQRADRRSVANKNASLDAAYRAGRSGQPPNPDWSREELEAHSYGAEEAERARSTGRPPAQGAPRRLEISEHGASFALGLVAYAVLASYLAYGWPGVKSWFAAKFYNQPSLPAPNTATQATPTVNAGTQAVEGGAQALRSAPNVASGSGLLA